MRFFFFLALFLCVLPAVGASDYSVSGVALHQCSCAAPCPCMFEDAPDNCALAAVYHLDKGSYDGVNVGGLTFVSIDGAVDSHPGAAAGKACCRNEKIAASAGIPAGVIYVDARASEKQKTALLALLKARGEWPGDGRPVKSVPISFAKTANGYKTTIPGIFRGETEGMKSRKGTPIVVDGVGFVEGSRWTVGRSKVNDLTDKSLGLNWHLPGTNGCWTELAWTGTN